MYASSTNIKNNNDVFYASLLQARNRADRLNDSFALLYLDIDHFTVVNTGIGYEIGNKLLEKVLCRLVDTIRETDIVIKLSDDEYGIIAENIPHAHGLSELAEKIIDSIKHPFEIDNHKIYTSASIGIAYYPYCENSINDIIDNAKTALYDAKHSGNSNYHFYKNSMNEGVRELFDLENDLREAIKNNLLFLNYQPKFCAKTAKITGYEVLLRWEHPKYGMVHPLDFIPILEKNGLILSVGDWVIETSFKQHKEWLEQGYKVGKLSLNLSPKQLIQFNTINTIKKMLWLHKIPAKDIELEITENLFLQDNEMINQIIDELHELGVSVAIDDFGKGYSSFDYLKRFKIDTLKIDKAFVEGVSKSNVESAITAAILKLSNDLNIKTVAEGVESKEQLDFLMRNNADEIQGFYYSVPLLPLDFIALFNIEAKAATYV